MACLVSMGAGGQWSDLGICHSVQCTRLSFLGSGQSERVRNRAEVVGK